MSETANETDAEIVARVIDGDRDAYAALVERYAPVVKRFLAGRGLQGLDQDEAAQDVFVGVYQNLAKLRADSQLRKQWKEGE